MAGHGNSRIDPGGQVINFDSWPPSIIIKSNLHLTMFSAGAETRWIWTNPWALVWQLPARSPVEISKGYAGYGSFCSLQLFHCFFGSWFRILDSRFSVSASACMCIMYGYGHMCFSTEDRRLNYTYHAYIHTDLAKFNKERGETRKPHHHHTYHTVG